MIINNDHCLELRLMLNSNYKIVIVHLKSTLGKLDCYQSWLITVCIKQGYSIIVKIFGTLKLYVPFLVFKYC